MTDRAKDIQLERARNLRRQRPISQELNFININSELWEIAQACEEVRWAIQDEDILEDALGGDEDAWVFQMEFSSLVADCDQMREELNRYDVFEDDKQREFDEYDEMSDDVPSIFDSFFPAIQCDDMYTYSQEESDYISISGTYAEIEGGYEAKRLRKLTKEELLYSAGQCLHIARQFLSIKYRYQCLKAALDVLRGENETLLSHVKNIEELYEKAETSSFHFLYEDGLTRELDRAAHQLPDRFWIE